jgi:hypothetical protein
VAISLPKGQGLKGLKMDTYKVWNEIFEEREHWKRWREIARHQHDQKSARSMNAKIGTCTRRMNRMLQESIDETTRKMIVANHDQN